MRKIHPSEITPESIYHSRRQFIKSAGILTGGALLLAACGGEAPSIAPAPTATLLKPGPTLTGSMDELGNPLTPYADVSGFNNFYEFSLSKTAVADLARDFETSPWAVQVGGLVDKPRTFDLDDLMRFTQEERIYRLRCVETWSMVVPWTGFPLATLLKEVEPTSNAAYVRFETLSDSERMPGLNTGGFPWPYVEGLRLDEAMNDLCILATGVYGKPLPPQNGAPVRLVVPWKYGFKSIKSIIRIDLVAEQPTSFWSAAAPNEYGFYANVNPEVPHPRWSQAQEGRFGESTRRDTLLFNGYAEEVGHLYTGMDLKANF
ncbi:MAG: protein-methionine-sulfoxide reductase catalytic subunit MsrP [Anaerolineales bacterium]|nr:MAG: protein-methionine-sulfoxide reductase catalytic subunit MsrP [Anaerolineales bacterium]